MMIERLEGRTSLAIAAAGLLLVVLVGWFGFVSPQRSKAAELEATIEQKELELATAQTLVRSPALLRVKAELATLRTAIPDDAKMSQLLRQLSKASGDARVRLLGVTPRSVATTGAADVVPLSLTLEGRYFGIREFLRLLRAHAEIKADQVQASGRLFAVEGIQFRGGDSGGDGLIQATLTVNAFAFSRQVAAGVVAEGAAAESSEASSP